MYPCKTCKKTFSRLVLLIAGRRKRGPIYSCRPCNTKRARAYRATPQGKANIYAAVYRSIAKYPEKQRARVKLNLAVRSGIVTKPAHCLNCPRKKIEAHHEDYTKPLQVIWMCRGCHKTHELRQRLTHGILNQ